MPACFFCRKQIVLINYQVAHAHFHLHCYPVPRDVLDAAVAKEIAKIMSLKTTSAPAEHVET